MPRSSAAPQVLLCPMICLMVAVGFAFDDETKVDADHDINCRRFHETNATSSRVNCWTKLHGRRLFAVRCKHRWSDVGNPTVLIGQVPSGLRPSQLSNRQVSGHHQGIARAMVSSIFEAPSGAGSKSKSPLIDGEAVIDNAGAERALRDATPNRAHAAHPAGACRRAT